MFVIVTSFLSIELFIVHNLKKKLKKQKKHFENSEFKEQKFKRNTKALRTKIYKFSNLSYLIYMYIVMFVTL